MTSQSRFIYVNDKGWLKNPSLSVSPTSEYVFTDSLLDAHEFPGTNDRSDPDYRAYLLTVLMLKVWFGKDNVQVFNNRKNNDTQS